MPDPKVDIKIRSQADNKGFEKGRESAGKFKDAVSDLSREFPLLGRAIELVKNPVVLLIGAFAGLVEGVRRSIEEFAKAETQYARLDRALAQSGQLTQEYRKHLNDLATAMQKTTTIADDQWLEVIRKLTQFGAKSTNIDQLVEGVANLAGVMDGDLASAADLVGRAIQGNFDAFSRYGIVLDKTGDNVKDLTALLKKLAELGEGQLATANQTLTGQFRQLKNATGDFFEAIGGLIAKTQVIQIVTYGFAQSLDWLQQKLAPAPKMLEGLTNKTADAAGALGNANSNAADFAKSLGNIKTEAESLSGALDKALAAKKALFDEQDQRDAAAEELMLAQIDKSVAQGKFTETDARIRKAGVKAFYAQRAYSRKQNLLQTQLDNVAEQDHAAEQAINEITDKIGAAQQTTKNATALEAKRQHAAKLKQDMLQAMADEEEYARANIFGFASENLRLAEPRVEGRRKRYFEAATELSRLAAGLPRNTPYPITARAREEAITKQGVTDIAALTAARGGYAQQEQTIRAQMETGAIRYSLGQQTQVTGLETSMITSEHAQREKIAAAMKHYGSNGGASPSEIQSMVNDLRTMSQTADHLGPVLQDAIGKAASSFRNLEQRVRDIESRERNNRDWK